MKRTKLLCAAAIILQTITYKTAIAGDTLRAMAYNVLYYGDRPACQGPHNLYHNYLKTIVAYANPDIISLEKMAAIPLFPGDVSGSAPTGFGDSILLFALNAAFPGRYAYCPFTNASGADNISMLFYDQVKLGFLGIAYTYSNITDFDTYKLYYKASDLGVTHDTVFLYLTLNHTNSGSGSSDASIRTEQIDGEMAQMESGFSVLPNMLNMGDFNTHNSSEACYQHLVNPGNAAFRFYDAPFSIDGTLAYPADWDNDPSSYASYLTTSTRQSSSIPNSCGSSGGGKSWYDHIFISGSIKDNTAGLWYVPHSYRTLGNDGNRVGVSINGSPANTSAPAAVIDALFQMSNKYPVMIDMIAGGGATHIASVPARGKPRIGNPVNNVLDISFDASVSGREVDGVIVDMAGRAVADLHIVAATGWQQVPCSLQPGTYYIQLVSGSELLTRDIIVKN